MGTERLNPDTVYTPPNESYSQAVKATGDTQVHVSGMVGLTRDGELVGPDMREQTEQALEMVTRTLDAAGADLSDVVRVRVLTTDADEYLDRCHELVVGWYGEQKPASTLHEVAGLAADVLKVEIEATALVEE